VQTLSVKDCAPSKLKAQKSKRKALIIADDGLVVNVAIR